MSQRQTLPQRTAASRLVVVLRGERAEDYVPVIDTMVEAGGGVSAVKVFPANRVGTDYLEDLRGPFPDLTAVPSGGVDLEAARAWLSAGAAAVSAGGPLLGDALEGGELGALAARARLFVEMCAGSGSER